MKFSLERVTKTKREEGIREQGRESDELVTKLRIKNTKKDESDEKGVSVGRGRVDLRQRVPRKQWLVISSP